MQKTSSGFGGSNPPTLETSFWYVYLLQCNDGTISNYGEHRINLLKENSYY